MARQTKLSNRRKDPLVHRPEPTMTAREAMNRLDARHMVESAREMLTCMPPRFKEQLRRSGCFHVTVGRYNIQITDRERFVMPPVEYGRTDW